MKIATPSIVAEYAMLAVPATGEFDWSAIPFYLDDTPNNVYGFCELRTRSIGTGKRKKFLGYSEGHTPSIVINRKIYEKFPNIANEVIIPHEMGHVAQWIANRQPGHDQFFDWVMRKMGVQEGATFNHDEYGLSEEDRMRLNMMTGKQEKVIIQHLESGEKFTITQNMWTRMIRTNRRTKNGLILTRSNCRVIASSSSI